MDSRKAKLLDRIESDRDLLLDFLRTFVRCPSPNPPGDTREAVAHIRNFLDKNGIEHRVIAPSDVIPNIIATFHAANPARHPAVKVHIVVFQTVLVSVVPPAPSC